MLPAPHEAGRSARECVAKATVPRGTECAASERPPAPRLRCHGRFQPSDESPSDCVWKLAAVATAETPRDSGAQSMARRRFPLATAQPPARARCAIACWTPAGKGEAEAAGVCECVSERVFQTTTVGVLFGLTSLPRAHLRRTRTVKKSLLVLQKFLSLY